MPDTLMFTLLHSCRQVNELQRGLQSATEQMLAQDAKPADNHTSKPSEGLLLSALFEPPRGVLSQVL